uniref:Uncharacterized protein n=1 Tax=Vitis vinifera TaxID=29760 RepID=A5CAK9_VITVI|nr:hypothetical protein VITISV_043335 [Vitis vinifera]
MPPPPSLYLKWPTNIAFSICRSQWPSLMGASTEGPSLARIYPMVGAAVPGPDGSANLEQHCQKGFLMEVQVRKPSRDCLK